jgi:formylglycine-generating enzyme required for sulfatase activity
MAIIGPAEYWMGAGPVAKETHKVGLGRHRRHVNRSVAISTTEVTLRQFLRLMPDHERRHDYTVGPASEPDCPVNMVSHADAMQYCLLLSKSEGILEDQWCYEEREVGGTTEIVPRKEFLSLTGYRLPTEGEWELACRADTNTDRFTGTDEKMITRYAWCSENAEQRSRSVGRLRPNPWGFFDVYGNAFEMCQDGYYEMGASNESIEDVLHYGEKGTVVLRGHHFRAAMRFVSSYHRQRMLSEGRGAVGFRIARSVR